MDRSHRDLLKHSGVYGLGHVLTRLASVLLLPVYTRFLTPADYGVLAILDLSVALLSIVLASGTVRAVVRHHFESDDEAARDGLWWTGLVLLVATGVVLLAPALLFRESIAAWTLGGDSARGGYLFLLALATLALGTLEQLFQAHLRVYKQSTLFVVVSLGRLVLNVALNLWFLIALGLGVEAMLLGNLLTAVVATGALFAVFLKRRGGVRLRLDLSRELFSYGTPLVVASLLATAMHQLDRYLLRTMLDLGDVGVYAVAYAIGQGINTLVLQPFSQIWYVVIYELDGKAELEAAVSSVFRYFFSGLALLMLGASLFAVPILEILVASEFRSAAELIPILCLAYLLFSLHAHFNLPPLLAKRTTAMIPPHVLGVIANVVANLVLIPRLGVAGAAWASVVTFAVFSVGGLLRYRRIRRFDYPLVGAAIALAGLVASYLAWDRVTSWTEAPWIAAGSAAALWLIWGGILGAPLLRTWNDRDGLRATLSGVAGR